MHWLRSKIHRANHSTIDIKSRCRFEALSRGIYPLSDEKLPEVFQSDQLSCEVDVNVSSDRTISHSNVLLLLFLDFTRLTKRSW